MEYYIIISSQFLSVKSYRKPKSNGQKKLDRKNFPFRHYFNLYLHLN